MQTQKPRRLGGYATIDTVFERFRYPAGEPHIRLRPSVELAGLGVIQAQARNFDDLAEIVTADRILRRNGAKVRWFVPYFPFARHDRRNDLLDGFELQLALEMVGELDVVIADPHSEVAAQLPHFNQADVVAAFRRSGAFSGNPIVVIPDAGAAKKAYEWLEGAEVIQAQKTRDAATGALSGFSIPVEDLGGRCCLIVDDICDGGGTFLGLAAKLREANAGPLTLAVTHGLFTKGVDALLKDFATIYCFESGESYDSKQVVTVPFSELYEGGNIR